MTKDEALKLALEALETYYGYMEPLLTVFGGPRVPAEQSTTWKVEQAIKAIKQVLANDALDRKAENARELGLDYEPEQEPVAWHTEDHLTDRSATTYSKDMAYRWQCKGWPVTPLYTTPPQRKPLTDEEIGSCIDEVNLTSQYGHHHFGWHKQFARAIEAAHGIKG